MLKVTLSHLKVTRDIVIPDDKGREMKAKIVFGASIKYLKDHLINLLKTKGTEVDDKHIHWVLTVPAIWTDSAKQFMRECAYEVINIKSSTIFCYALMVRKDVVLTNFNLFVYPTLYIFCL
jgi:hypothetical protein